MVNGMGHCQQHGTCLREVNGAGEVSAYLSSLLSASVPLIGGTGLWFVIGCCVVFIVGSVIGCGALLLSLVHNC